MVDCCLVTRRRSGMAAAVHQCVEPCMCGLVACVLTNEECLTRVTGSHGLYTVVFISLGADLTRFPTAHATVEQK